MPRLFNLPGPRDGPDNIFTMQTLGAGTYEIPVGGRAYASFSGLFWTDYSFGSIVNRGTIWNTGGSTIGGWNLSTVENFGLIVAGSTDANVNSNAIWVGSWGYVVNNWGQIYAIGNGIIVGINHWAPDVHITNGGLIAAYAPAASPPGTMGGGPGQAIGVSVSNGAWVDNRAGAAILAEGLWATALGVGRGDPFHTGVPSIRNAGRIEAYSLDPANESVAISTGALTSEAMLVENSGLIRADIAYIAGSELGYSPPQQPADQIVNRAGGQIFGRIETRLGADEVINDGEIHGRVLMGEGADLFDSWNGVLDGPVLMEWGEDRFFGSNGDDAASGGRDADWMEGGAGNDLLLGGLGDDTLVGGAGNDRLYGEYGADRIVALGGDAVDAGAGDDIVEVRDLGFAFIQGGDGIDRLTLAMGAGSLDLSAVLASGRVNDIEGIEMRGQQRLVLRAPDIPGLTNGDHGLKLLTTTTDTVELIGAWTEVTGLADTAIYRRFVLGNETALVAGAGAVVIAPVPSAPGAGLDPVAPGSAALTPGSVAGVDMSLAATTLNWYYLHASETVQAYEVWRSDGGLPVVQSFSVDYTLTNYGLMESVGPGTGGAKVLWLSALDQLINYGTIRAVGPYADIIYAFGSTGRLLNYGLIEAVATAGQATGANNNNNALSDEVNFENYGIISVRATGKAVGAMIGNEDKAFNFGTITAVGGDNTVGVSTFLQRGFINYGTITADLAAGASGTTTGLLIASGFFANFANYGVIHGMRAIASNSASGYPPGPVSFCNYGRLEGSIELGEGASRFENWGLVTGAISLGPSINLWFGAGGQQDGALAAGDGADILIGGAAAETLRGENGDDYLVGGGGGDQLGGGAGRDLFVYAAFDQSTAASFDTISDFLSGTDRIDLSALGVQSASIQDGGGFTLVSATNGQSTLVIRVNGTVASSDLILGPVATITGTSGADSLAATAGGSAINGGEGADLLIGAAGNDRLDGGAGLDTMWGGMGDDIYVLDHSMEVVWEVSGQGTDLVELGAGQVFKLPENVENMTLLGAGFGSGNDLGNLLRGSAGDDTIRGFGGDDAIEGGAGNDRIEGGAGNDRLTGGAGADRFAFVRCADSMAYEQRSDGKKLVPDVIADFSSGVDKIDLEAIDAIDGGYEFDAFTFIGTAAFTHHAGEVRYEIANGRANIYADTNGDGFADMHIVAVTTTLAASDFVL